MFLGGVSSFSSSRNVASRSNSFKAVSLFVIIVSLNESNIEEYDLVALLTFKLEEGDQLFRCACSSSWVQLSDAAVFALLDVADLLLEDGARRVFCIALYEFALVEGWKSSK